MIQRALMILRTLVNPAGLVARLAHAARLALAARAARAARLALAARAARMGPRGLVGRGDLVRRRARPAGSPARRQTPSPAGLSAAGRNRLARNRRRNLLAPAVSRWEPSARAPVPAAGSA
jgi:hypothetical protein